MRLNRELMLGRVCAVDLSSRGALTMPEQALLSYPQQHRWVTAQQRRRMPPLPALEDPVENTQKRLLPWLETLGMFANPFAAEHLDAGGDPFLASYLVGHHAFQAIRQAQPSLCFAPVGGGKSAFRVRLARACRVGEDGQHVLPIVYTLPSPTKLAQGDNILEQHLHFLNQRFAIELLFALVYRPNLYLTQTMPVRHKISALLQANFPGEVELQLEQLANHGDLSSLIRLADPSAEHLIAPPTNTQLSKFCTLLHEDLVISATAVDAIERLAPTSRFQQLVEITRSALGYTAIYVLIDGVDAYWESLSQQRKLIRDVLASLVQQTAAWGKMQVYAKYFLPTEFVSLLKLPDFVAPGEIVDLKLVSIDWTPAMLEEVLQERLRFASRGRYTNLDAICAPGLRQLQRQIVEAAAPLPREVLVLAERVLLAHLQRMKEPDLLEQIDFDTAKAWYQGGGR